MLRTCMSTVRGDEEEVVGDLAVRAPDGDEPQHLALAAREAGAVGVGLRAHAEPLGDRLAERGRPPSPRRRPAAGRRACAPCGRRCTSRSSADVALAGRREHDAGAQLDLRALERHVEVAVQLDGAGELVGGGVRVALEQRRLGDRVRERGERVGVAGRRRPCAVSASAHACAPSRSPWAAKNAAAQRSGASA